MWYKSKRLAGMLATTLLVGGCTSPTYEGLSATADGGYALNATVRYLSACPTNGINIDSGRENEIAESAGPLRGVATDFALNLIGSSLDAAIKGRNGQFVATGVFGTPENIGTAGGGNCLVIYRGVRGKLDSENIGEGLGNEILNFFNLAEQPGFYLELKETRFGASRILSLNHLQYAETSANQRGSGTKSVAVVLGLTAASLPASEVTKAKEVYRLNLGRLRVGHIYGPDLGVSAVSAAAGTGIYNVIVQVVESDQPSLALQALSDAFTSNRPAVAAAIKN